MIVKANAYAEERGLTLDAVKLAASATGQGTHPNTNLDSEQLDAYFAANPPTADSQVATAPVAEAPPPVEVIAQVTQTPAAAALSKCYGLPGAGKVLWNVTSIGGKEGKFGGTHVAWGYDETTAIAEVIKANGQMKRAHSGINWRATKA